MSEAAAGEVTVVVVHRNHYRPVVAVTPEVHERLAQWERDLQRRGLSVLGPQTQETLPGRLVSNGSVFPIRLADVVGVEEL